MVYVNWLGKLNKNLKYIVAVSGGPDSMFLLDNLVKNDFDIVVGHVNYHKRWSSNVDQKIVEDYCKEHKIPLEIKNVKPEEYGKGNFQDQARVIRYNFFNDIAHKYQTYNLIVAHHVYDLLETYLIQKQRKAIVSYYGLKFKNTYKNLSIYRPMLELKKEDILDYLTLYRIKYGFDETNELEIYERNKIRQQKINKLTDFDINLMLSEIKELNSEQELLKDELEVIYNSIIVSNDILSVPDFLKYNDNNYLQQMIIYEFLFNYDEDLVLKLKKAKIKEIVKVLSKSKKPNISFNLSEGAWLIKEYNYAYISEKKEINIYKYIVKKLGNYHFKELSILRKKPKENEVQALYVSKQDFPLTIRTNTGTEEISVSFGTKKINRLFIDNKIPYRQRLTWPVIVNSQNQVIAIPGLAISKNHLAEEANMFVVKQDATN
ncbi:tRNA lysidine(34) synthetase TilS [Spiroplasma platyhelix]|uniref:tRNA(Ile)-lysidine synthase n=1 Tax=Spiroplasma platyhelix PALS-1 TaxID=1276218 RepID=A0A846U0M6_9MOLU|nr:tRNA lysidine(34) synthetase TilS [Spiroplasma platyhelix]MBE4704201.1 tRNA(Ile)-lysidine synthase [Spiroplasma platyhelix PALS-1]NKE38574.1 tRNA lysidine(34) synthetase TilS [Spiroplasma platyhelix PALS-1]UJB28785.1 tRNA(Ile)-lysidine synthase [Spiroplasma platyhelix PALS-1]